MSINIELLKEICEVPGAPGFEQKVREIVIREVKPLVDEIKVDNMGNLTAIKKGKEDKKVMLGAHMDEIGFLVSYIDDNGFVHFRTLGGFDPKTLTAQRVIIHGKEDVVGVMGSKPVHMMSPEERTKAPKIDDYFIDLGMSKEDVEKVVEVGNPITRERQLIEMGDCINCKSLDNRVSVFILIEALRNLSKKEVPYDIYGVFTVQEEMGVRGAPVATQDIQPDFGIAIDITIAFDVPGSKPQDQITKLGEGTAIKIMDSATICDYRMVNFMKQTANKNNIKWQPEVLPVGSTDTWGIQRMTPGGSIAGAISIPTRHVHQVIEMVHKDDVTATISLVEQCLLDLNTFDWSF